MLRPSYLNILFYLLLKYIVVFIVFMIVTNNYKMLMLGGIKDAGSLFYYLWMILFFPAIEMILFSLPLYLAFKVKSWILFFGVIAFNVVLEYFVYVHFTSQQYVNMKGIYIGLIGLTVLTACFFKTIALKFNRAM